MKTFNRALITGASKGLGKEIVLQLAPQCENLVLLGRDEPALDALKQDLQRHFRGEIDILVIDLSDIKDLEKIKSYSKSIDLLINNAGLGFVNEFSRMSEQNLKQMLMVNNYALTMLSHWFAKKMSETGGGQIVNIASAAAFLPIPYFSVYAATKSYVLSLSQALDWEMKSQGVRVKVLCPGGIKTNFHIVAGLDDRAIKDNEKFVASPQEVAAATLRLIHGKKSASTQGLSNKLIEFVAWLLPDSLLAHMGGKTYQKLIP